MSTHSGPVRVSFYPDRAFVSVSCPRGHVITGRALDADFPGSSLEARISAHQHGLRPWVVECDGTLPEEAS